MQEIYTMAVLNLEMAQDKNPPPSEILVKQISK